MGEITHDVFTILIETHLQWLIFANVQWVIKTKLPFYVQSLVTKVSEKANTNG